VVSTQRLWRRPVPVKGWDFMQCCLSCGELADRGAEGSWLGVGGGLWRAGGVEHSERGGAC